MMHGLHQTTLLGSQVSAGSAGESVAALPKEAFTGTLVGHQLYLFGGSIRGKVFLPGLFGLEYIGRQRPAVYHPWLCAAEF